MDKIKSIKIEQILFIVSILFFLCVNIYKINATSLWYDEGIEYWYSIGGKMPPGVGGNMGFFDRIRSTNQPPLYNIMMYFWLKINNSQLFFRLFGVIVGCIGICFLYKSIQLITKNKLVPFFVSIFTACILSQIQYYQEAAEYCLLLSFLYISLYFFLKYCDDVNVRNLICLCTTFILLLYSQYGAVFFVIVVGIVAIIHTIKYGTKKDFKYLLIAYSVSIIGFGLPLYFLFFRFNVDNNKNYIPFQFKQNIFMDFITTIKCALFFNTQWDWVFSDIATVLIVLYFLILLFLLIKGERKTKQIILINLFIYFIYYLFVKAGLYANSAWLPADNEFKRWGSRWGLFLIPTFIIMNVFIAKNIYTLLHNNSILQEHKIDKAFYILCIFTVLTYCSIRIYEIKKYTNLKQDMRGAVEYYLKNDKNKKADVVITAQSAPCFSFYMTHNGNLTINELSDKKFHIVSSWGGGGGLKAMKV